MSTRWAGRAGPWAFRLGAGIFLLSLASGLAGVLLAEGHLPGLGLAYLADADRAFRDRDYRAAARQYEIAARIAAGDANARLSLGHARSALGDVDGAISAYRDCLVLEPGRVDAHYNLAYLLLDRNENELAAAHLALVVRARPEFAEAHHNLAVADARLGRWEDAETHALEALRIDPSRSRDLLENIRRSRR